MRTISTGEIELLAKELREFEGFFIDKFYELGENRFRIAISKNKVKANLQIILSHTINRTKYIEKSESATNFAMAVRKRTEGFNIQRVEQFNNDRIMRFEIKKGDAVLNIVIEMFGKGNLVITDKDLNILLAYDVHDFKDRSVRPGERYIPPKQSSSQTGQVRDYSKFGSLQEALDEYYHENPVEEKKVPGNKHVLEIKASIEKQEQIIKEIESSIKEDKEAGEQIMNTMKEINNMISALKANKRMTKEELQAAFPKIKVLSLDLKDKTVTIEV